jgi:hypothetical protein
MPIFEKKPKREACSHCASYVEERDKLCGNCLLIPPEQREVEKRDKERRVAYIKQANEAANKAFIDEMRKLNKQAAEEVTGGGHEEDRLAARAAAFGKGEDK